MGVELTQHITNGTGRFLVLGGGFQPQLRHGINNPTLHRLEPIPYVGQCTVQDHVHGVVEVGLLGIIP